MENTVKLSTETWKNEDLLKIQYRILDFQVVYYETNIQPHEQIIYDEKLIFNSAPQFHFNLLEEKVFLDFTAQIYHEDERDRILSKISTRSHFGIKGLPILEETPNLPQVKIPQTLLIPLISIAISSTRGIWSLISGGKFILPVIDLNQFKIIEATGTDEITPISSFPTIP